MVFNDVVSKLVAFDRYCRDLSGQLFAGEGDVISDLGVRLEQIYIVQYSECKSFAVFLQACVFVMVFHGILFASVGCLCRFGICCARAVFIVIGRHGRISSDRASCGNSRKEQQGGNRRNYLVFHSLIILFSEREPLPPRTKSGFPLFGQVTDLLISFSSRSRRLQVQRLRQTLRQTRYLRFRDCRDSRLYGYR